MPKRPRRASQTERRPRSRVTAPLAIIDIGSNSGRVTVVRVHPGGHLEVLADARAPLRLARDLADGGRLSALAIERTLSALHDFRAIALGAGATNILAVATSAVRESSNAHDLVDKARVRLGIKLVVIDGEREAAFAFLGAVHALPVDHGLLLDLGGGSLEVSKFRDRRLVQSWTLPLGALRISDRFLQSDPPSTDEIRRLRAHVSKALRKAGVPKLEADELLIGTGGTIRNIAKIEASARRDILPHLHGYILERTRVRMLARRAAAMRTTARVRLQGLNKDRVDSIVGGFLVVQMALEHVGAEKIQVSGQGLREGIALATLGESPPPAPAVRQASVEALMRRFTTCNAAVAQRRARIGRRLLDILWADAPEEISEVLHHVCLLLDIGRSIDYYDRHRNAAVILAGADLQGFTQRGISLAFAVLMHADNAANRLRVLRPDLRQKDEPMIERAATLLLLADEVERRSLPGQPVPVRYMVTGETLVLRSEMLAGWRPRSLGDRFRRAFGRELRVQV